MIAALEGGESSAARPSRTLPPGKTRYPFYRRLGGSQGRSGWAENFVPTVIRSRTVQPVVSRYTDWATRPTCGINGTKLSGTDRSNRTDAFLSAILSTTNLTRTGPSWRGGGFGGDRPATNRLGHGTASIWERRRIKRSWPVRCIYRHLSEATEKVTRNTGQDAGLLARSKYSEGPATGHLDSGFSWFPCVYKQKLRWFPKFQVATTCFSCMPSRLNK